MGIICRFKGHVPEIISSEEYVCIRCNKTFDRPKRNTGLSDTHGLTDYQLAALRGIYFRHPTLSNGISKIWKTRNPISKELISKMKGLGLWSKTFEKANRESEL